MPAELGTGLRATCTIAKDVRIDTGIARRRFNQTLFQQGEMVQDHNTRSGYVVGGERMASGNDSQSSTVDGAAVDNSGAAHPRGTLRSSGTAASDARRERW